MPHLINLFDKTTCTGIKVGVFMKNLQTDIAGTHWKVLGEQELGGFFPFY